jgi:hypothetical protein
MMKRTKSLKLKILFALLLLPLSACNPQTAKDQPTAGPAIAGGRDTLTQTPAAVNTPPPSPAASETQANVLGIEIPDPAPGMANVAGRIFWNDEPVDGLGLILCDAIDLVSGCIGTFFEARTDENGIYLFTNIAPGEYELAVETLDFEHLFLVTAGLESGVRKHSLKADATLRIPDQSIFNFNLTMISPEENEVVTLARPVLEWQAYPDAAYYRVFLQQENGVIILKGEETSTSSITPAVDLKTCGYAWQVEAYNTSGTKIAEHDGYSHFKVADQPLSC